MTLQSIKAREEKATPGPWEVIKRDERDGRGIAKHVTNIRSESVFLDVPPIAGRRIGKAVIQHESWYAHPREADAEFIAHARADVPALVAAVPSVEDLDAFEELIVGAHAAHDRRLAYAPARCWVTDCNDKARRLARLHAALAALEALP